MRLLVTSVFALLAAWACSQPEKESDTQMPEFERSSEPQSDVDAQQTGDGETAVAEDRESEAADSEPVPEDVPAEEVSARDDPDAAEQPPPER